MLSGANNATYSGTEISVFSSDLIMGPVMMMTTGERLLTFEEI